MDSGYRLAGLHFVEQSPVLRSCTFWVYVLGRFLDILGMNRWPGEQGRDIEAGQSELRNT